MHISHGMNNVDSRPGMSFKKNGTTVAKRSSLYLIGDTDGTAECYTNADGGNYSADYVPDNQTFTVPDGVQVKRLQPAGCAFGCFKSQLRDGPPQQHGSTNDQDHDGGDTCPNDMPTKVQGRHSGAEAQTIRDQEIDYEGFQDIAGDAGIVLVTEHNRWFHGGITLKSAIHDIRKAVPGITRSNCVFCRVDDTTASLARVSWNASPTTGGQWY